VLLEGASVYDIEHHITNASDPHVRIKSLYYILPFCSMVALYAMLIRAAKAIFSSLQDPQSRSIALGREIY